MKYFREREGEREWVRERERRGSGNSGVSVVLGNLAALRES